MKGSILEYSETRAAGVISGDDQNRYTLAFGDWKSAHPPVPGMRVDFIPEGALAKEVYELPAANPVAALFAPGQKNRVIAAVFAIFLGTFGLHKFYLCKPLSGTIMLVLGIVGWVSPGFGIILSVGSVVSLLGIVEGILYLTKSDADFERIYVKGSREWL